MPNKLRIKSTFSVACMTIIAISLFVPLCSKADDPTAGTGVELATFCNDKNSQEQNSLWFGCAIFINGVVEGIALEGLIIGAEHPTAVGWIIDKPPYCIPKDASRQQQALVVTKYLNDHPEELNKPSAALVFNALHAVWPCLNK
ncbi:MAG: Rap1a/Tai family immunity protein [Gammaproteobacteria bacterium]